MYALNRNTVSRVEYGVLCTGLRAKVVTGSVTTTEPRPAPPPSQGTTGCRENLTRLVDGVT